MAKPKITLDLTDNPKVIEMLRFVALQENTTQKAIVVKALEAYFSNKRESALLLRAAERSFEEWNSPEDSVYDAL